ncbi:hypothetical protein [Parapedobacter sp.]|uniref:hypothetical protein n=1 Tax=Parapedobacter sp. TaxID=1958893 RepID=UPI002D7E56CF|nr:hypothetical protein [Parapedobacter sp.]
MTWTKNLFLLSGLWVLLLSSSNGKIDREKLVGRHRIITEKNNPWSPAQVGNGEFAFGVDITGLQSFTTHATMSHWGWHSFPLPEGLDIKDFNGKMWDTYGRQVRYDDWDEDHPELSAWLAGNPHSLNLGRIGLVLKKSDGSLATLGDLANTRQETDLWTGTITSTFELEGTPVRVVTLSHGEKDAVGVQITSRLVESGQIAVAFSFPYPDGSQQVNSTFDQPNAHTTEWVFTEKKFVRLERTLDDTDCGVSVNWMTEATFQKVDKHAFQLVPESGNTLEFVFAFSDDPTVETRLNFSECQRSSITSWKAYWMSGAAIDLSASTDPRWKELERRLVLSQYVMKVNEAGSWPPQESGLVNNGWYGRFHFEMIWWHGAHFALWDRWPLFDRSLHVYPDFLPTSRVRAEKQGYKGARWPKCTAYLDRDWPHPIHATLIWQQPHPIFFAELDYRLHPTQATLDKWRDVVFESAAFMADFAHYDAAKDRYVLGPPVYIVSENTDPRTTVNPTFELSYWQFGLRTAQVWKERMNMPRDEKWDDVLNKLSPLPIEDGVYVTYEGIENMWTRYNWEHPALIGAFGMLPGDGVDVPTMGRTLERVHREWKLHETWGWDFPMLAMSAARLGRSEQAVDYLLEYPAFLFDEHGLVGGCRAPFPYFPGNGGLLYAVAMMAAGWDGGPDTNAPGFPDDGSWVVKWEGLKPAL